MKKETLFGIGLVAVSVVAVGGCVMSYNTNANLKELLKNMDKVSDNLDIPISEKLVNAAVNNAADKAAKVATSKAVEAVKEDISKTVAESVKKSVGNIKPLIKSELEKQLTMLDISMMKKEVVKTAAGIVADGIAIPNFLTSSSSTAEIIKACSDAGMSSWDIQKVLEKCS